MLREKLKHANTWRRIFYERFSEPSISTRFRYSWPRSDHMEQKYPFDLITRQHYAYGCSGPQSLPQSLGLKAVTIVEFGVDRGHRFDEPVPG